MGSEKNTFALSLSKGNSCQRQSQTVIPAEAGIHLRSLPQTKSQEMKALPTIVQVKGLQPSCL